jgi:hypothetical protein
MKSKNICKLLKTMALKSFCNQEIGDTQQIGKILIIKK